MRARKWSREELAFLASIHESPREDTPRLAFADWLEERGDPLGEFIRLQCGRARSVGVRECLRGAGSCPRERELNRLHGPAWCRPLARRTSCLRFLRGLPLVSLRAVAFSAADADEALARASPAARFELALRDRAGGRGGAAPATLEEGLRHPIVSRVSTLVVTPLGGVTAEAVRLLARCPQLPEFEHVLIGGMLPEARDLCRQLVEPHVPVGVLGE